MLAAFEKHEATTHLPGVSTHEARLGRWLIVSCAMQLLSRLTVDVQGLHYRGGVGYFLNAGLAGCPPWENAKVPNTMRAAGYRDSCCWLFAKGARAERKKRAAGESA
ncbi:hypothetical protein H2203_003390 [Taxawa tesnikishii (nom. ined.)]|nr:hypothetical protein H2203_003390 [Dothideales sp. JES 119]